ncbi:hypothetical protein M422DRAFT_26754 [Sphaerobolus stellatus SS14]|nr:hypothetical protein M422DRAFT_26754 [Sphaerobolus stellatus SS14]
MMNPGNSPVKNLATAMEMAKNENDHKIICAFTEKNIDPESIPTIFEISYGIDRILFPNVLWDRIPDLLDLLALAEEIRKRTVENATEALTWDDLYRSKDADGIVDGNNITQDERAFLKKVKKLTNDSRRRETYRTVVLNLCLMHLRYIRQSEDTYLIPFYFPQYFPGSEELKKIREEKNPLWLSDMSETELDIYKIMREKSLNFLEDAEDWEARVYPNVSEDIRLSEEYHKKFEAQFPPFFSLDNIVSVLRSYIQRIVLDVETLQKIFISE